MKSSGVSLVKVKEKYQVTLPAPVRKRARVRIGDLLEAKVEGKQIRFTPKAVVDRALIKKELRESFEDIRRGRVYGPFSTAEEMIRSLRSHMRQKKR